MDAHEEEHEGVVDLGVGRAGLVRLQGLCRDLAP
jgi:hypothetical protein